MTATCLIWKTLSWKRPRMLQRVEKEVRLTHVKRRRSHLSVVREHYLRSDITCKVDKCTVCDQDQSKGIISIAVHWAEDRLGLICRYACSIAEIWQEIIYHCRQPPWIPSKKLSVCFKFILDHWVSDMFRNVVLVIYFAVIGSLDSRLLHYAVPDVPALSKFLEVFEHPSLTGCILLQTALAHIRSRVGRQSYHRAKALLSPPHKDCVMFSNEYHRETFAQREKLESLEEWQERWGVTWS